MVSNSAPVAIGDVYCVTAHPYIRWTVAAVNARPDTEAEIVLRSTADEAVQRTVAIAVLRNPLRFKRVEE